MDGREGGVQDKIISEGAEKENICSFIFSSRPKKD